MKHHSEAEKIIQKLTEQNQCVQDDLLEARRTLCHAPGLILEKKHASYKVGVSRVGAYKRRQRSAEMLDSFIERMKPIHCPNEEREFMRYLLERDLRIYEVSGG